MKHNRLFQFALIVITLMALVGSAHTVEVPIKAQPELIQLALANPSQDVSVIVQKIGNTKSPEAEVAKLGGRVAGDLSIINSFYAEMTAEAAVELSRVDSVRWVSLDAKINSSACSQCIDTTYLANAYISTIRADKVWNTDPSYLQGQGVGIAIVDSGVNLSGDFYTNAGANRQIANVRFNTDYNQNSSDGYGHGTHVASVAAGDGSDSSGKYIGVAPMANIINVKVSNDDGSARTSDVILGLQWVLINKDAYNIRVVNLSFNSTVAESYNTSPLDAAVEILWFNKIVVVVSAGNQANGIVYPPANDPFVITVGATDDKGTKSLSDDAVTSFSAYGTTPDGVVKPDLVAPGKNIIARIVNLNMGIAQAHPSNIISNTYFKVSGTSVSAPMVSGAVAILLQSEPDLNPDQVKYRLLSTANKNWAGYNSTKAGAGYLDILAAVKAKTTNTANTNLMASKLLTIGSDPITWGSMGWNSMGWNSMGWNSMGWNSMGWNSDYWDK
jgi:serine protease AprX